MTVEINRPPTEEDDYRPPQFTLRSLLIFTTVACVVMSISGILGGVLLLLIVMLVILAKLIEADFHFNRDNVRRPLLALAAFLSLLIFPLVFVSALVLAGITVAFLFGTLL